MHRSASSRDPFRFHTLLFRMLNMSPENRSTIPNTEIVVAAAFDETRRKFVPVGSRAASTTFQQQDQNENRDKKKCTGIWNTCLLLGICALYPAATAWGEKIWESDRQIRKTVGDIRIEVRRSLNPNADYDAFFASTHHLKKSILAEFRGSCNEVLSIRVILIDKRKVDLNAFLASRSGRDLPISDILEQMRLALLEQCPQVQAIRLNFNYAQLSSEDYRYTGTMVRSTGWKLQDGIIETAFDNNSRVAIAYRDRWNSWGVSHEGKCEEDPVLIIEHKYTNLTEKAAAKPLAFSGYVEIAEAVSGIYASQCSKTAKIRYILSPMPRKYTCSTGDECFLTTHRDNGWQPDESQFKLKKTSYPIQDFDDIEEVLAAGKFEILRDYPEFFHFFTNSFLALYSENCMAYIKNPVKKKIQTIKQTFDGNGSLTSEAIEGPPRIIHVERKYAEIFDRTFDSWKPWATNRMVRTTINNAKRSNNPITATFQAAGFFTANINQLERRIKGKCKSNRLQVVYTNLYNLHKGKPALTGKYSTDKTPLKRATNNGSSAPRTQSTIRSQEREKRTINAARKHKQIQASQKQTRHNPASRVQPGNPSPSRPVTLSKQQETEFIARYQALILDHTRKVTESGIRFQKRYAAAKTRQERIALIEEQKKIENRLKAQLQNEIATLRSTVVK